MSDERSPSELGRILDAVVVDIRDIREKYLTEKIFLAMHGALTDRVLHLEQDKASRRNALLAVAGTVVGVVLSVLLTYLLTRGGH